MQVTRNFLTRKSLNVSLEELGAKGDGAIFAVDADFPSGGFVHHADEGVGVVGILEGLLKFLRIVTALGEDGVGEGGFDIHKLGFSVPIVPVVTALIVVLVTRVITVTTRWGSFHAGQRQMQASYNHEA